MKVEVPAIAMPLLKKYKDTTGEKLFNFHRFYSTADSFNKVINYGLKEIGKILKVDDLEYW